MSIGGSARTRDGEEGTREGKKNNEQEVKENKTILKFWRVTIRGAQPSPRLYEEFCLSEGFLEASARSTGFCGLRRVLRGSAGFSEVFRG